MATGGNLGSCPSWYPELAELLVLRHAYPGVSPMAWRDDPVTCAQVLCALRAQEAAARMLREQAQAEAETKKD